MREKEREGERDRETERQRQRDRERDGRVTERWTSTKRHKKIYI